MYEIILGRLRESDFYHVDIFLELIVRSDKSADYYMIVQSYLYFDLVKNGKVESVRSFYVKSCIKIVC